MNRGVPNSAARSRTSSPPTVSTPAARRAVPGQISGSRALRSWGGVGGCSAGSTSACRGPAGWATRLMARSLAGRSGVVCCGGLGCGPAGRAAGPAAVPGGAAGRDGAGYIRLGAAMPSNRRPVPRTVRAPLASCSRAWMSSPPAGRRPARVRPRRNRAGPHHRAGLLPVEVPAGQVLQVGGDHVRLPTARRPGHPFREPGHRVEQHPLAGVREQARLEPLHVQFRQPEVSSLPQRRRGVSVRVPNSIGGIAQVLRGHGPGGQAQLVWPGRDGWRDGRRAC